MCAQTNRLRMGHKSACILQPILGQYLEYDGEMFTVLFGSVLCIITKFDNYWIFFVNSRLLAIHLCWLIVTGVIKQWIEVGTNGYKC